MRKFFAIHRAVFIGLTFVERDTDIDEAPRIRKVKPLYVLSHQIDGHMIRGAGFGIGVVKVFMLWLALWTIFKPGAMDIWRAWTFPLRSVKGKFYELIIINPLVFWVRSLIYYNYVTASI